MMDDVLKPLKKGLHQKTCNVDNVNNVFDMLSVDNIILDIVFDMIGDKF